MNPDSIPDRIRQGNALLVSAVFLVLIWLPTADWIFHFDRAPIPNEKRLPAAFPKFNGLGRSRDFVSGLEQYFNDHFGFRKRLIRANNHWKRQVFRDAPSNDVITGRDGWLFSTSNRMLDHYFGLARFSQDDLEAWRQLIEERRDWLAKRGIKYLFTIPPDKHTIYPEYLPEWLAKSAKPTKLDQFMEYMKAHSTVEVLDLRGPLLNAKPLGAIYLKTDTHWNMLGGFIAYQALIQALSRQIPDLKPLPLNAFDRQPTNIPAGDLAEIAGNTSMRETQQVRFTPRPPLKPFKVTTDPSRLLKKWTKGTDPTISESDRPRGKAILFRDSFSSSWKPILGYHFKEVLYIWQYYWDAAFLEREKPDVVIDEILERFFNTEDPRELMRKDDLRQP